MPVVTYRDDGPQHDDWIIERAFDRGVETGKRYIVQEHFFANGSSIRAAYEVLVYTRMLPKDEDGINRG